MRWRSPSEISFRVRQEVQNVALRLKPPALRGECAGASLFPDAEAIAKALRGTEYAARIMDLAQRILEHRFPLLGIEIETGPEIQWRRDYLLHRETAAVYFRRIPYLDVQRAGDHKTIWELNRHQHLVVLAQAYRLSGRAIFLAETARQLESWLEQNPYQRGINWTSALEVAIRSLSWMWVLHLSNDALDAPLKQRMMEGLYWHGYHLAANLSIYFSPNTHLLGEAIALHALGRFFHGTAGTEQWESTGASIVAQQMIQQVREDGSHIEQSSYYHVYALDMLLFHTILTKPGQSYTAKLVRMAEYLDALMGASRSLPFFGDDDGGRFFHPYGARNQFGRATLATCGAVLDRAEWIVDSNDFNEQAIWWLGPRNVRPCECKKQRASRLFPGAGMAVMASEGSQCIIDAGSFGPFRGGHSHADTLSIVARSGSEELLIDPGTYTYVGDPKWRDMFRGTAAHNTIRLQGLDQAEPAGAFGWRNPPQVTLQAWHSDEHQDYLDADCRYREFRHRRRVCFLKPQLLFILDEIEGDEIDAEQFWHTTGRIEMLTPGCFALTGGGTLVLALAGATVDLTEGGEFGWRSRAFGSKEPTPVIVSRRHGRQSLQFGATLAFSSPTCPSTLTLARVPNGIRVDLDGAAKVSVTFSQSSPPEIST